jgi:hypothetical protein
MKGLMVFHRGVLDDLRGLLKIQNLLLDHIVPVDSDAHAISKSELLQGDEGQAGRASQRGQD